MSTNTRRSSAALEAKVLEQLRTLCGEVADVHLLQVEILNRLDSLERRMPGTTRTCDVGLVLMLADRIGSAPFTASDVFERVRLTQDDALACAMRDADLENPRGLGWFLRRVAGVPCDGYAVARRGDGRHGGLWQVVRVP